MVKEEDLKNDILMLCKRVKEEAITFSQLKEQCARIEKNIDK